MTAAYRAMSEDFTKELEAYERGVAAERERCTRFVAMAEEIFRDRAGGNDVIAACNYVRNKIWGE
jgi:hypothetical protein